MNEYIYKSASTILHHPNKYEQGAKKQNETTHLRLMCSAERSEIMCGEQLKTSPRIRRVDDQNLKETNSCAI